MANPSSDEPKPNRPPRKPAPKGDGSEDGRPIFSGSWLLLFIAVVIITLFMWRQSPANTGSRVDYTFFWKQVEAGNVDRVAWYGEILTGKWKKIPVSADKGVELKEEFNTVLPIRDDATLKQLMIDKGVRFKGEPQEVGLGTVFFLWVLAPSVLLILFLWYMMKRSSDPVGSGMIGNFIRSPAKRFRPSDHQTTFDDVAAMEQAKQELQEVVEFLKTPAKFQRLGAQIPKGVLLMGPPGTGKTLLARATAGEAGVPFFSINGSEFIQMFVGVGASRVRDMFRTAKENSPCILFIDEIDAVGRIRGAGLGGGHDEREQTLNQILSEMDGFQQTEAVIVVAATNRPDVLDPALLRPGRFDRHVTVDRPNKTGREAILKVHCRKVPLADNVNLADVASGTIGFSGAELKNLVNEAALNAARMGRDAVTPADFDDARDKVLMGPEREDVLNEKEKEMTAYHEAGHALLAWLLSDVDSVHKVTIIPRGRALGVTQLLPAEDRYNIGEHRLHSQLAFMLGGRAAEKLVFNEYSAGASDDLKRATQLARSMVAKWGMSELIGPVAFRDSEEHPFLGKEIHEARQHSEETARQIDVEIQRFLREADVKATETLQAHRDKLDGLTKALIEKESLGEDEIRAIIGNQADRSASVPDKSPDA
ncbi:ATP-dependent zinc metalloprotease FtsH [Planctellipticum variicoloris]|uniref:ATP-dependent zinc metalloprotease FtsH n=1 Tax=Planctellipticum variicoloris TaxID=3064265 RepID=UPI003013544C|nr:ATP-dependent zinc metalloprotease FtsH [Planctomycetaceae bacterium SH412]